MRKSDKIELPSGTVLYERVLTKKNGLLIGAIIVLVLVGDAIFTFQMFSKGVAMPSLKLILYALYGGTAGVGITVLLCRGLKTIKPNEAAIFTLLGRYHATITQPGLYYINPFATEEGSMRKFGAFSIGGRVGNCLSGFGNNVHRIPLSPMVFSISLDNVLNVQKGYVLSMNAKIEYQIQNPTRATFAVDSFGQYLYENCESVLRELIRERLNYGEMEKMKIDTAVAQITKEISETGKIAIQNKLEFVGVKILSITIKEAYDKREKRYYSIEV